VADYPLYSFLEDSRGGVAVTESESPGGPVRILISSCLLGRKVRYDGGHKLDPFLVDTLGPIVEFVPVCPEVECGLPVPREPMTLAGDPSRPRLVTVDTGVDHTRKMRGFARGKLRDLARADLSGYICKEGSPSCGMEGMFTKAFRDRFPRIPAEEEGRLRDPALLERFLERVLQPRR
jgi:uncharacterized protein YbbK (DUF523 family)